MKSTSAGKLFATICREFVLFIVVFINEPTSSVIYPIRIENSKGNKDRYTLLAKSLVAELREYYKRYKPVKYLFNGRIKGFQYSQEGLRWTFNQALLKSAIQKDVSLHSLRHAFASHLLAMGTSLFTIQKLLGHDDIRTTMLYLQVNHEFNQKPLISPLDLIR